eukprot:GHVT01098147.1.p1 GENE.GHVT01098147.1~~GHVT01098147.1.p1  ORF type:complete len:893 (-),score=146.24 GHVT01098147.1:530-3208(-)
MELMRLGACSRLPGISQESGIPTYRSLRSAGAVRKKFSRTGPGSVSASSTNRPDGLCPPASAASLSPSEGAAGSPSASSDAGEAIWDAYLESRATVGSFAQAPAKWYSDFWVPFHEQKCFSSARPSPSHERLALAVQNGDGRVRLVTQNVDGLHLAAGTPGRFMIEAHGRLGLFRCASRALARLGQSPDRPSANQVAGRVLRGYTRDRRGGIEALLTDKMPLVTPCLKKRTPPTMDVSTAPKANGGPLHHSPLVNSELTPGGFAAPWQRQCDNDVIVGSSPMGWERGGDGASVHTPDASTMFHWGRKRRALQRKTPTRPAGGALPRAVDSSGDTIEAESPTQAEIETAAPPTGLPVCAPVKAESQLQQLPVDWRVAWPCRHAETAAIAQAIDAGECPFANRWILCRDEDLWRHAERSTNPEAFGDSRKALSSLSRQSNSPQRKARGRPSSPECLTGTAQPRSVFAMDQGLMVSQGLEAAAECSAAACVAGATACGEGPGRSRQLPVCSGCGCWCLPLCLLFDEQYDAHEFFQCTRWRRWLFEADALIFIGTSFSVGLTDFALLCATRSPSAPRVYSINTDTLPSVLFDYSSTQSLALRNLYSLAAGAIPSPWRRPGGASQRVGGGAPYTALAEDDLHSQQQRGHDVAETGGKPIRRRTPPRRRISAYAEEPEEGGEDALNSFANDCSSHSLGTQAKPKQLPTCICECRHEISRRYPDTCNFSSSNSSSPESEWEACGDICISAVSCTPNKSHRSECAARWRRKSRRISPRGITEQCACPVSVLLGVSDDADGPKIESPSTPSTDVFGCALALPPGGSSGIPSTGKLPHRPVAEVSPLKGRPGLRLSRRQFSDVAMRKAAGPSAREVITTAPFPRMLRIIASASEILGPPPDA